MCSRKSLLLVAENHTWLTMLPAGKTGETHGDLAGPFVKSAPKCAQCNSVSAHLRRCERCLAVQYCSKSCQARHWIEGGHRQQCAALAATRAGGGGSVSSERAVEQGCGLM